MFKVEVYINGECKHSYERSGSVLGTDLISRKLFIQGVLNDIKHRTASMINSADNYEIYLVVPSKMDDQEFFY